MGQIPQTAARQKMDRQTDVVIQSKLPSPLLQVYDYVIKNRRGSEFKICEAFPTQQHQHELDIHWVVLFEDFMLFEQSLKSEVARPGFEPKTP